MFFFQKFGQQAEIERAERLLEEKLRIARSDEERSRRETEQIRNHRRSQSSNSDNSVGSDGDASELRRLENEQRRVELEHRRMVAEQKIKILELKTKQTRLRDKQNAVRMMQMRSRDRRQVLSCFITCFVYLYISTSTI